MPRRAGSAAWDSFRQRPAAPAARLRRRQATAWDDACENSPCLPSAPVWAETLIRTSAVGINHIVTCLLRLAHAAFATSMPTFACGFAFDVPVKYPRHIQIGTSNAPHEIAAQQCYCRLAWRLKRFPFEWMQDGWARSLLRHCRAWHRKFGFTRLAARNNAELGQARVLMQSIFFAKRSCEADGPPNSGLPEFGFHSCASRINPTCVVRPAGDDREWGKRWANTNGNRSKVCTHKSRLSGNHWLIVRIAPESGLIADIGGWSQMC